MLYTNEITMDMTKCIQDCRDCHNICMETTDYCIRMGGKHVENGRLNSLMDCADTCRANADFLLRGSSMQAQVCDVCVEECERCAELCAELADDVQMWACLNKCLNCIESCREMAGLKVYLPASQVGAQVMYN